MPGGQRISIGSDLARVFAPDNPGLAAVPGRGAFMSQPEPAAQFTVCGAERNLFAGGLLAQLIAHPTFVPLEYMFRKLPQQAIFFASPEANFRFELGAFRVPGQMALCVTDFRFTIYRLSGAAPGDFVPLEDRRLSGQVGYDVNVSDYRKGQLQYQLDPTPVQNALLPGTQASEALSSPGTIAWPNGLDLVQPPVTGPASLNPFPPSSPPIGASQTDFLNARSAAASSPGGPGLSTLPQRVEHYGAPNLPFTILVHANQRIALDVIVFKPVPIPVAFFEGTMSGILVPQNVLEAMLKSMQPCLPPAQGDGR